MANAAKAQISGSHDGNAATAHVDTFARQHLPPPSCGRNSSSRGRSCSYPPRLNCVSYFLDRWVEQGRRRRALRHQSRRQLHLSRAAALVNRIANVLVGKLGLVTGGRVLLRSANNPMMVATYLAVIKAGGIVRGDHAAAARQGTVLSDPEGEDRARALRRKTLRRDGKGEAGGARTRNACGLLGQRQRPTRSRR